MIPALHQYPRFEKGSPSTEYLQIVNFCVNYLEGVLVGLIHMDIPPELEKQSKSIKPLQKKLVSRERTVRHAFQFQVEKHFSDFKSISRTRLKVSYGSRSSSDHTVSRTQDFIERIGEKHQLSHKKQLQNTARRLKTLVHRSDENYDDNPISPLNLCWAFLASIEPLNFSAQKNRLLFDLFDHTIKDQLKIFYNQIDLGLYYLDILTELTDPSLFEDPQSDDTTEISSLADETNTNYETSDQTELKIAEIQHIENDAIQETTNFKPVENPEAAGLLLSTDAVEKVALKVSENSLDSVNSDELEKPSKPVEAIDAVESADSEDLPEPVNTEDSDNSPNETNEAAGTIEEASKPVEAVEVDESIEAVETENPELPSKSVESIDALQPEKPDELTAPDVTDDSKGSSFEIEEPLNSNETEQDTDRSLQNKEEINSDDDNSESVIAPIHSHQDRVLENQDQIEDIIYDFKISTENGTLDFISLFSQLNIDLCPLVENKLQTDIQKFTHFYTSLLNNSLLSTPLKTQLSRLSAPLLEMVLVDPFFFRSSSHPVNDFLQSIIDFELRFNHQGESLSTLSQSIDSLLQINNPTLNDYQPLIESYEQFKEREIIRIEKIKEVKTHQEEELKNDVLNLINDITEELVVDHDTMQFFYDDWQFLLLHLAHEPGRESAEFKNSVNIAKMLGWFLDHNKTGPHPRFESTSFKSLLTSIEIGLVELNFSSEHRHRVRKQLIHEYKQANQRQSFTKIPSESVSLNKSTFNSFNAAPGVPEEDPLQFAENLSMGDWVEIKLPSNTSFTRAKLKWKAADFSLFIFIDQRGHKIKECDLKELQTDFSASRIKQLKKPSRLGSAYY